VNKRHLLLALGLCALNPLAHAAGDSVVVVNEVHYNPTNPALEYVELRNQLSVNVDMSGWRFDGGITFEFAEGTVIPARGFLVVASDPAALQAATGITGVKGPYTGALHNDGETLSLWNNNAALRTRPNPPPVPAANEIWSVDIQGDGAGGAFGQTPPVLKTGVESVSGLGNVWNALTVAGHSGTTVNPSLAIVKDSTGSNTSVAFSITGTVSGFTNPGDALNLDYLFLAAGGSASSVTWQITGLNPAKTYSMWFYTGPRTCRYKVDKNGNGSIADDTALIATTSALVSGIVPDATGKIIGNADTPGGEVNWSGFQLFVPATGGPVAFDPGVYNTSLEKRRLMDEFTYADSGKWPVGPDGSPFTLAKIDEQGGGQPSNWTTSAQANGTPGAQNFLRPSSIVTSALDTSGNNRNATSVAGVQRTINAGGYEGEAFIFDGAGSVDVPINITPAVAPSATIGAWVQATTITPPARHEIMSTDNGGFDRALTIDSRLGSSESGVARYGAFGGGSTGIVGGMNATTTDGWVFVCAAFDAAISQTRLYVNGNAYTGGMTHGSSITTLRIGSHPSGIEPFRGKIDNVFAFNRALTATEIADIRTGGAAAIKAPALATNLLGLYEFEAPGAANLLPVAGPTIALNEVGGAGDTTFRVELYNYGADPIALDGWTLTSSAGAAYTFPVSSLAAGAYLTLDQTTLGYRPANNARLFLRSATRMADAAKVANTARARETPGTGRWLRPNAATFGTANTFAIPSSVVINEIFHTAFDTSPEQWLELHNRSVTAVNVGGWKLKDGITYTIPVGTTIGAGQYLVIAADNATLLAKYPGRSIIGNFSGGLGDADFITLEDLIGNPVDEVEYFSEGRWPAYSDRGGASIELRDPDADNAQPEAWAASNTAALGAWQTVTYSGVATDDGLGFDAFRDFMLGMLESGEVLIDDVSVRESPSGANTEFIQNGTFESDTLGAVPQKWRCLGNHGQGRSVVITDPDNASNKCLRIVATGNTEDKSNRIETTFLTGRQVTVGNTYQISFRARWMAGSNQVNTRLYFNYLQRTTLLNVGNQWGTPGLVNSVSVANIGPTVSGLAHTPIVPLASNAVTVSARVTDADAVASASLFYRVGSGSWQNIAMTLGADGRHSATIPAQAAGALVQFYVRGTDGLGAIADFPAGGTKGGAFYRVGNNDTDLTGLRGNLRVLISPESETALFLATNRMSNDTFPATIIEDERIVYYGSGMKLKGSAFGRYAATEFGYSLDFPAEQPFRGVHTSVSIERAANMKEIVAKHILNRAGGGYWSQFDDVARINGPGVAAVALIAASRTSSVFLKSLFPNESTGTVFNHELLYQPNGTTDGNQESLKLNNPYNHDRGTYDLLDRGTDKEAYRWGWQIRSKRRDDNYTGIVRLNRAFALSGTAFTTEIDATIDVDQWMRTWAIMGLYGNDDQYGRFYAHNWRLYQRPTDGRLIALPWDLDRAFQLGTSDSLFPNAADAFGNFQTIRNLFTVPAYKRAFDSHMLDLVNTTLNSTYMTPWITHLTTVTGETTEFAGIASYIGARSNYALSTLPASVPFTITTNGGADFTTAANSAIVEGNGWSDVFTITRSGQPTPLAVTWTGSTTWRITVPLIAGANVLALAAFDPNGTASGTDSITITSSTTNVPAGPANTVISEVHYHPADPSTAEFNAGHTDADDFQFIELHNISATAVELAGSAFTQGLTFNFTTSTVLPPSGVLVLARNAAAFQMRHGFAPSGTFIGRLSHSNETLTLLSATSANIETFRYQDGNNNPWPASADGLGASLQLIRPRTNPDPTNPANWTSSAMLGGSPGTVEDMTYTAWLALYPALTLTAPLADPDNDGQNNALEYALRTNPLVSNIALTTGVVQPLTVQSITANYFLFTYRRHIGATSATWTAEFSPDLITWQPTDFTLLGSLNNGDGTETLTVRSIAPVTANRAFGRLRVTLDP
jgi:Lamin Tail Domain/Concanavalin A-like lectin/glucanases superfamily/CotH kinase protein